MDDERQLIYSPLAIKSQFNWQKIADFILKEADDSEEMGLLGNFKENSKFIGVSFNGISKVSICINITQLVF